jgi:predicted DNA-binding mobile mystery protein A
MTYKEVGVVTEDFQVLKRKQLDEKLQILREIDLPEIPRGGWVKAIRTALAMPSEILGKRIGVSQSAVIQFEKSEEAETITLASLRKLAAGIECDLFYALVPKRSLNEIIEEQALHRARSLANTVSSSMELEAQGISEDEKNAQVKTLAKNLLNKPSTGFWDDE